MFHRNLYRWHNPGVFHQGFRRCLTGVCVCFLLTCVPKSHAANQGPDVISIAAVLIQDGKYEKALGLLDTISPEEKQNDEERFYALRGIAALRKGQFELAQLSFVRAIEIKKSTSPQTEEGAVRNEKDLQRLHGYLAMSLWGLDDCEGALAASERAGNPASQSAKMFVLRADCHERTGDVSSAFDSLRRGQSYHPDNRELVEKELHLLAALSLYAELRVRADSWMAAVQRDEGVRLLAALNAADAHPELIYFGERLRMRFPDEPKVALFLAQSYRKYDHPLAAARTMEELSLWDETYVLDAAELYRRAGWRKLAQIVAARSRNQVGKIRQQFGMLLEDGRFDEAAALASRLRQQKLLEDDSIRYALAYAQYETGLLSDARDMLREIRDEKVFRQAAELRQLIDACDARGWLCR